MLDSGLTEKVSKDKSLDFRFPNCGKVRPSRLSVFVCVCVCVCVSVFVCLCLCVCFVCFVRSVLTICPPLSLFEYFQLPPPVLMVEQVSFKYPGTEHYLYKDLEFGLDLDSRLALVGPNGAGKSTLLKLLVGKRYLWLCIFE